MLLGLVLAAAAAGAAVAPGNDGLTSPDGQYPEWLDRAVPPGAGPAGLREAARDLLADPVRYYLACGAAYCRSRNYRSADQI